jgi:hypothetical protein
VARIRTIKPEFFTSEDIVCMSPLARLFYVSLWCESDRDGRLEWKPVTFKMRYLPGDQCDVNELAKELIERGLIVLYSVDGKQYAEIPTFTEHQVINNREASSTLPARDKNAKATRAPRVKAEGKEGKEGKGREKEYAVSAGFDSFWKTWPKHERKQDRKACWGKWQSMGLEPVASVIVADVEAKKDSQKWRDGYVEMPETYLNNRRWEDGMDAESPTAWTESRAGIESRGIELGLGPWDEEGYASRGFRQDESFNAYKHRVLAAHHKEAA